MLTIFRYRPDEISLRMVLISQLGQFSGILCALLAYGLAYIDGRGGLVSIDSFFDFLFY